MQKDNDIIGCLCGSRPYSDLRYLVEDEDRVKAEEFISLMKKWGRVNPSQTPDDVNNRLNELNNYLYNKYK